LAAEIPINLAYEDDLSLEIHLRILKSPDVISSEKIKLHAATPP